jgi:putative restriction endonuclease
VIRGSDPGNPFAPQEGYRYDGLFRVEEYWRETGRSGFTVWRFRLRKLIRSKGMEEWDRDGRKKPSPPSVQKGGAVPRPADGKVPYKQYSD